MGCYPADRGGVELQMEEATTCSWPRAMAARRRHQPSRSAPPKRWTEEHFLQGNGDHPHPDPICSSAPSPPKAALSHSSMQPRAVQRRSYRPFVNTTPPILLPTIKFNFC